MFNTIPDWIYNFQKYYSYSWDEIVGWVVTSFFAGFIFTFREWGVDEFDPGAGLRALIGMTLFLLIVFALTTTVLKVLGLRLGYQMHYQPHLLGLMGGLVIAVASAGYLPIFIPGGFEYKKPERLYVGHWRGFYRAWETAMLAGGFPMLLLFYAFVLNRVYLSTGSETVVGFIGVLCLTAVYCLIPIPNVALEYGGRVLDFFRYLKGMTFGLDVYMNSRIWFVTLSVFTILTSALTWGITVSDHRVGTWLWFVTMFLALIVLYLYKTFYERLGGYYRH